MYTVEKREGTRVDERFTAADGAECTARTWNNADGDFVSAVLYVGGWRRGVYRTQAGLARAVDRLRAA